MQIEGRNRIIGMDALRLQGPSYSVLDGCRNLLLTHVLRRSPSALKWRNGWGETSHIEPGAMLIKQGPKDSLVEIAPVIEDELCECIRLVLRADVAGELTLRFDAYEFPFCNSPQACVRVMLGSYRNHIGKVCPLPLLNMLDIDLAPNAELNIAVAAGHWALAILTSGSLQSCGALIEPWHAVAFQGGESPARLASETGASVLWFGMPCDSNRVYGS